MNFMKIFLFFKILFKFLFTLIGGLLLKLRTFDSRILKVFVPEPLNYLNYFIKKLDVYFKKQDSTQDIFYKKTLENKYLLFILCWLFRFKMDKDFEFILSKRFKNEVDFNNFSNLNNKNEKLAYDSIENKLVSSTVNEIFEGKNSKIRIENVFLHNKNSSSSFLLNNSDLNINFRALEDFYSYLKLFGDETRLSKFPAEVAFRRNPKLQKKYRIPKKFRGGLYSKPVNLQKSNVTQEQLKKQVNTLKQVEFLLKNKDLILSKNLRLQQLDITDEVKSVMFSYYNPVGPYGPDTTLYTGDLVSKNKTIVSRRVNLIKNNEKVADLDAFNSKVGFLNFNTNLSEEWENSSDVPVGGWFTGQFYFINPFLILLFIFYSFFEFFLILFIMSSFFGNPFDTFFFFLKYPLLYYYEHLTTFPSPNYFFFSLMFWFFVFFVFSVHLLQILDSDRFEPPRLSWIYNFFKDFFYNIFLWWCVIFCIFEIFSFLDLLFTRIFFIGTPGYPQILSAFFLIFYDLFYLLGTTGYFSFYLENFLHLEIKFPIFYFTDYSPILQRYPLVQPYFIGDPYSNRLNFFLWFFDNIFSLLSGDTKKLTFFSTDSRIVFQREIIQDIRKYNFLRKNYLDLKNVGQIYLRGWNGFNYRLDLQNIVDPIIPTEQVVRFDWRFKNTHSGGLYSRLFKPSLRFGSTTRQEPISTIRILSGRRRSSRYGYFDYLRTINNNNSSSRYLSWYNTKPSRYSKSRAASKLKMLADNIRKSVPSKNRRIRTFLFRPAKAKFRLLLSENLPIQTKADRNFRASRLFFRRHFNLWSYIPGNSKPHRKFYYKPFLSFQKISNIKTSGYLNNFLFSKKIFKNRNKIKSQIINPFILRDLVLNNPAKIFPTSYVNQILPFSIYNSKKILERDAIQFSDNFKPEFSKNRFKNLHRSGNFFFDKSSSNNGNIENNFEKDQYFVNKKKKSKVIKNALRAPRFQRLRKKRFSVLKIPDYPFKSLIKYRFISTFFSNFQPKYFLRAISTFSTFSKIDYSSFKNQFYSDFSGFSFEFSNSSHGLRYPFSLFFSGFGKIFGINSTVKLFNFDHYYSQNHNFFYTFLDFYFKKDQFRTLPTNKSRFSHPLFGGLRYNLDFLYPMISELRLKEKIVPLNFLYENFGGSFFKHLRLDPYETIKKSAYSKSSCYSLDTKIQNWLNFNNVIWNDFNHFFYNRSFKTEGNGLKFCLASFNPINGPVSYKLFIGSPTLELPRIGQYFYNYIPWLQYKFKWLISPTSTYKRFDTFRAIHQHSNKKFYFTSLLKFYQMNLYRWQQYAQIHQWNFVQSRNFLVHLFFHKYRLLKHLQDFKLDFSFTSKHQYNKDQQQIVMGENFSVRKKFDFSYLHMDLLYNPQKRQIINNILGNYLEEINILLFSSKKNSISNDVKFISKESRTNDLFIPSFTYNDFNYFQRVIDLRRWKALQASFIRDWKFDNYLKYLGPVIYREDMGSLMGFFAPFEYRNQIFVTKLNNDAFRFSVFFPKKVIDEQYVNPLKRLKFPYPRFSKAIKSTGQRKQFPSYYAYVINRPFVFKGSNYTFLSKKGKKILHGFYPHLQKYNISNDLNLNYGQGLSDSSFTNLTKNFGDFFFGSKSFYEINSKKKRILKDKHFWLNRNYELENLRNRLFGDQFSKSGTFGKFLDQLGKPLNLDVPRAFGKFYTRKNQKILVNFNFFRKQQALKNITSSVLDSNKINALLYPNIYRRFGGSKINSKRWNKAQSWMKFVVATQNTSVRPSLNLHLNPSSKFLDRDVESEASLRRLVYSNGFLNVVNQNKQSIGLHRPEQLSHYGFFNFGLSGIGRLPRLSRSFFHMLFFRNKLNDFKNLKISFLKIYFMSLPIFNNSNSDLQKNVSFNLFWSYLLGFKKFNNLTFKNYSNSFRYKFLFNNNFHELKFNFILHSYVNQPFLGSLVSYYNPNRFFKDTLILNNQYIFFKSYKKFIVFSNFKTILLHQNFSSKLDKIENGFLFFDLKYYPLFFFRHLNDLFFSILNRIKIKFKYFLYQSFNLFFLNSNIFVSQNEKSILFVNKTNINFKNLDQHSHMLNSFFSYSYDLNYNDLFRSKFYFGTFRSSLGWYFYPVQIFFSFKSILYKNVYDYFYNLALLNEFNNFKYFNFLNYAHLSYINFFSLQKNNNNKNVKLLLKDSYFLNFYITKYSLYFFTLNSSNDFYVRLNHKFLNPNFLKKLYLFQNTDKDSNKFVISFNSFFFSLSDNLLFFSNLNIFFGSIFSSNFLLKSKNYIFDFDKFISTLETNVKSIDGSGRYTRPKGLSISLDKVFTYREYEKYRKEHHRQRFRGISPHWIQTSFKNRLNFKRYYQSSDFIKARSTKRILNYMSKSHGLFRFKNSPRRLRHISSFNNSINQNMLNYFLNRPLFHNKLNINNNSSVNFVDTTENAKNILNFKQNILRKKYNNSIFRTNKDVLKTNRKLFKKSLKRKLYFLSKVKRSRMVDYAPRFSVTYKALFRDPNLSSNSNVSYRNIKTYPTDFSFVEDFLKTTNELNNKYYKINSNFDNNNLYKKLKKKHESYAFKDITSKHYKVRKNLQYVIPQIGGNSDKGGSFINVNQANTLRNIFQHYSSANPSWNYRTKKHLNHNKIPSQTNYFSKNLKFLDHVNRQRNPGESRFRRRSKLNFSSQRHDDKVPHFFSKKKMTGSVGFRYPQHKASLNSSVYPYSNRVSPKYLGSKRTHEELEDSVKNSLPRTNFSGITKSSRSNYFMYDHGKKKKSSRAGKLKKYRKIYYAPNVKRFIRKYNRVLMHIPYLYSKWFTQNPRLTHSLDNIKLNLFLNNQYDEFNSIFVQSLFLLKRKIMYNVISLKLLSYKHKILYFKTFSFSNQEKLNYVRVPINFNFYLLKFFYFLSNYVNFFFQTFSFNFFLNKIYILRHNLLEYFFSNNFFFLRLLYNPKISKFKHDSEISSDLIFFEDFYYKQTNKRILSQIAFTGHSLGGWNNPLGLMGHYIPGLNFYVNGSINFNFNYQYPDFYSGRFFSPEMILDNNIIRQNNELFDRNFFFNEFYVNQNYRRSWHFLTYRISSPISPFIEYEKPHSLTFKNIVKRRNRRLPLASLRRVYNIYPNHISSFFSTLFSDTTTLTGHDVTLPLKLKLLNYKMRSNPEHRRTLVNFFANNKNLKVSENVLNFYKILKLGHLSVISDFHKRINLSSLVNKRRFAMRNNAFSPIRYNYYYFNNWKNFLHKFSKKDYVGFRNYKLSSFFDLYQGNIPLSLKIRSLHHLIVSQIPRFEIDSRRKVPLNISARDFSLLFYFYFKYVNDNFTDYGYSNLDKKIFKYSNRKVYPFLYSYFFDKNDNSFFFKKVFNPLIYKKKLNMSNNLFRNKYSLSSFEIPEYFSVKKQTDLSENVFLKIIQTFLSNFFVFFQKPFIFRNWIRNDFFLFNFSNYNASRNESRAHQPWFLQRFSFYKFQKNYDKYRRFFYLTHLGRSRSKVSRLFGIHTSYVLRKHKERSLNPSIWLKFDLFSRVRPSFKPFITKFSKNFVFSKYLPSKGIPSYNYYIKSHTAFDNYFDKHPYISYAIGLGSNNDLISSETSYKEIKRRSQMLDFARSHNNFKGRKGNILNNINRPSKKYSNFVESYNYDSKNIIFTNHKKKHPYKRLLTKYSHKTPSFARKKNRGFFHFKHFKNIHRYLNKSQDLLGSKFILNYDASYGNSQFGSKDPLMPSKFITFPNASTYEDSLNLELRGSHNPHTYNPYFSKKRRANNLLKDSIYFTNMSNLNRRSFFLNTILLRPNTAFLKFVRSDNFSLFKNGIFLKTFFFISSLNYDNQSRFRSFSSPNLKVFFDFNTFKQRYNLGLLFRNLSFDRDFEFFLFKRQSNLFRFNKNLSLTNVSLLSSEFTKLNFFDYFEFLYSNNSTQKGFLIESRISDIYFSLEKFFLKSNPLYLAIVFLDFYLFFLFSIISLYNYLNFFDFSIFIDIFNFTDSNNFVYIKKRPVFQVLFHINFFKEYLKFTWLFSLKFLIFNIEYYPYYFILFSFLLIMRALSYNIQRNSSIAPFIVPYVWRFSDLKLNSYNGWFDSAWNEIKSEALGRLHDLHLADKINLSPDHLFSLNDIRYIRKKNFIKKKKYLVELNESDISLADYEKMNSTNVSYSKPVVISKAKGSLLRSKFLNFYFPSFFGKMSDNLQLSDSDGLSKSSIGRINDSELLNEKFQIKRERISFGIFRKNLFLFFKRKITFSQFLQSIKFGNFTTVFLRKDGKNSNFFRSTNYTVDDFGDEYGKLFIDPDSEFNFFMKRSLKNQRMSPDDENILFYRKPGSFLHSEIMSRKFGTEVDQLHYIIEFPGKFNNTFLNSFSKTYAIRNLNFNNPQIGYFSFSKNSNLPTNFEEFLLFCSYTPLEIKNKLSLSKDSYGVENSQKLSRLHDLWSIFQYVTKYEYNMFNEYNSKDISLLDYFFDEDPSLIDNIKFWFNKASIDSIDFRFFQHNFFLVDEEISDEKIEIEGGDHSTPLDQKNQNDMVSVFKGESPDGRVDSFFFSIIYLFHTYLFLFLFFLFVSFLFCISFLFLFFLYNYVNFFI